MARESYAALVARHTAILEELHMELMQALPHQQRLDLLRPWNIAMHEIQKATKLRIEASDYEYQRREGKHLAELARIVRQRRG